MEEFRTRWIEPRYFVFVCAGDFAQVRVVTKPMAYIDVDEKDID